MNIKEIASVAELMTKHELTEFKIESEELKLVIRRERRVVTEPAPAPAFSAPPPPPPTAPQTAPAEPSPAADEEVLARTIDSPIVGTFYAAPAPGADPFVKAGDDVKEDTVVCIVEAMKVMNEVKAECSGRIKRVLVDNAESVEYGQPMFELE